MKTILLFLLDSCPLRYLVCLCVSASVESCGSSSPSLQWAEVSDGTQRICLSATAHVLLFKNNRLSKSTHVSAGCLTALLYWAPCMCVCVCLRVDIFMCVCLYAYLCFSFTSPFWRNAGPISQQWQTGLACTYCRTHTNAHAHKVKTLTTMHWAFKVVQTRFRSKL